MPRLIGWIIAALWSVAVVVPAFGQAECGAWGNLHGIRVDGELMAFTTGLRTPGTSADGRMFRPRFSRRGDQQTSSGRLGNAECIVSYSDIAPGSVRADIQTSQPLEYYVHLSPPDYPAIHRPTTQPLLQAGLEGPRRQIQLNFQTPTRVMIDDGQSTIDIHFALAAGKTSFTITASGDVDKTPATLALDRSNPGSPFAGVGGNFRIQGPFDPPIVQYNLDHLRVAWARVAMPLNLWQPTETSDPAAAASNIRVVRAMAMAGTLARRNIPLIISVWSAPNWALIPGSPGPHLRGHRINPAKWDAIDRSIGSYLQYLKAHYGAEPRLFSFNESDLGIDVLQSPQEHDQAIRQLGAYFASHGFSTKMLLGDTSDATPMHFIDPAMDDAQARPYIGAVSFHSWRGGSDAQYAYWGAAAKRLNLPLLVAEGGTDPDSFAYPAIFQEPWYALNEISQYVRICRLSQPLSILQWQLTNDYSLLIGGRDGQPLEPTQRFWQLKQFDLIPPGSRALPIDCDQPEIFACAYQGTDHSAYCVHLVNNGPSRPVTLTELPADLHQIHAYVTDSHHAMAELPPLAVTDGAVHFTLDTQSFMTLITAP